jgi:hypothetical protein
LRYGAAYNRILGAVFAAFIGSAPILGSAVVDANNGDPLTYDVTSLYVGNGQGFFTEHPGFGFPGGGSEVNRFQAYVGDTWKVRNNLSLSAGIRYVLDTGRVQNDLPPIPCTASSAISCTGNLLDQFGAGLGGRVRQPYKNFAPTVGVAWDPWRKGRTVLRGGFGIYYDTALFNNTLFDRTDRLQKGLFLGLQDVCGAGLLLPGETTPRTTVPSNGHVIATQVCGQPIGSASVQSDALELEALYKQATITAGAQVNGGFIGNLLADGLNATGGFQLLAPNYRTPYGMQFNIGGQHELRPGTVLSVDYVRNVGLHTLLGVDTNHVGDARYFNVNAALNAISATNNAFECGTGTDAASINCAISAGATIYDYAGNGLDSGNALFGGVPAVVAGLASPDVGAAFPGINPNVGQNQMLFGIGHSVYNALQAKLTSQWSNPLRGVRRLNTVVSYSFSRSTATARDVDFYSNAYDFNNTGLRGPNGLDRTHQLSAGAFFEYPYGAQIGFITHWYSALPATLFLPTPASTGAIFTSDLTGDGSFGGDTRAPSGDILPGTGVGAFGRDIGVSGLVKAINNYNTNIAGHLTPAGQALVSAGLFTEAQLVALGAVTPTIALPPSGAIGLDPFFTFDLRLSWKIHPVRKFEGLIFEPTVNIFNLFNRQNFDSPSLPTSGILNGTPGFVNGTTRGDRTNLIGLGSGVFALGAPRSMEFGFKVVF